MTRQGKRTFDNGADPIGLLWRKLRVFFTVDRNAHLHLINSDLVTTNDDVIRRLFKEEMKEIKSSSDSSDTPKTVEEMPRTGSEHELDEPKEWRTDDEERYKNSREKLHAFARQVITSEYEDNVSEPDLTEPNQLPPMARKSNTACHTEFKTGTMQSNAIFPPQAEKRKRSSSSEKRQNHEPVMMPPASNDEVFEENDPYEESIFVYSARDSFKRKARKNLLTFKSPPPPEILDATTLTVEHEKKRRHRSTFDRNETSEFADNSGLNNETSSSVIISPRDSIGVQTREQHVPMPQFRNATIPGGMKAKRVKRKIKKDDKRKEEKTCQRKFISLMKQAWYYDCNEHWYHFAGKGAAWLVILTPFILLFGPFLMSCYIFNLNKRFEMCWHKCWKTNPKYDWFNCKGKGTGWTFLLLLLYVILSPILICFTLFTFMGLILCSLGQTQSPDEALSKAPVEKQPPINRNPFFDS